MSNTTYEPKLIATETVEILDSLRPLMDIEAVEQFLENERREWVSAGQKRCTT